MKLYDIIKDVAKTSLPDMEISDVTSDTRKAVKAGSMFVCIKGKTFDGHDAAKDMIDRIAVAGWRGAPRGIDPKTYTP